MNMENNNENYPIVKSKKTLIEENRTYIKRLREVKKSIREIERKCKEFTFDVSGYVYGECKNIFTEKWEQEYAEQMIKKSVEYANEEFKEELDKLYSLQAEKDSIVDLIEENDELIERLSNTKQIIKTK